MNSVSRDVLVRHLKAKPPTVPSFVNSFRQIGLSLQSASVASFG